MSSKKIRILKTTTLITCAITFLTLSIIVFILRNNPPAIDVFFRDLAYDIRGEKYGFWYWVFIFLTEFGNYTVAVILLIVVAILTKLDYKFFIFMFGIMISLIINVGVKDVFSRERPLIEYRWATEDSSSFPSGHSTAAGFMYTFIIYLVYHEEWDRRKKYIIYILCALMMPIVMVSRIILGVHYFTDVIAGLACGIMVSALCMLLYRYCANNNILTVGLLSKKKKELKEDKKEE